MRPKRSNHQGIRVRHSRSCALSRELLVIAVRAAPRMRRRCGRLAMAKL
jgi:hypothetical protein